MAILREADACTEPGQIGALLRRHGIYSSYLAGWRKQRDDGALAALGKVRGRKPADPTEVEVAKLREELAKTKKEIGSRAAGGHCAKNVSALLGGRPRERGDESETTA